MKTRYGQLNAIPLCNVGSNIHIYKVTLLLADPGEQDSADTDGGDKYDEVDTENEDPCTDYEIRKCNSNNCTERSVKDVKDNKPYTECNFQNYNENDCKKDKAICVCKSMYIRYGSLCLSIKDVFTAEDALNPCKRSENSKFFINCKVEDKCEDFTCDDNNTRHDVIRKQSCHTDDWIDSDERYQALYRCTSDKLFCSCKSHERMFAKKSKKCLSKSDFCHN